MRLSMSYIRKIILCIYALIIAILGILFVPCRLMYGYGDASNVLTMKFVPVWKLIDKSTVINNSVARYDIDIARAVYTFVIITLITAILYIVVDKNK